MDTAEQNENRKELGQAVPPRVLVGTLVLVVLLAFGGLYYWHTTRAPMVGVLTPTTETKPLTNNEPETPRMDADVQALQTMSSSDELSAITADLDSTNLDSINTDMQGIGAQLTTFESQTRQ